MNPVVILVPHLGLALGGAVGWSALTGTPFYITGPVVLGCLVGLLILNEVSHRIPAVIARGANRLACSVRKPRFREGYPVPGVFFPLGFYRLLSNPREYAVLLLLGEDGENLWRKVLRMTRGQRLFETFGWGMEAICRHALKQDDPAAVIAEAKALATEYPPFEVGRYAGHPAGARRGFELLRAGIPYEFGELLA